MPNTPSFQLLSWDDLLLFCVFCDRKLIVFELLVIQKQFEQDRSLN